ncbi:MAG: hypothetical protein HQ581_02570, partial [Planctomycetes bacterium]|nr:hypothetical protein [Planctomycetota bacterium]
MSTQTEQTETEAPPVPGLELYHEHVWAVARGERSDEIPSREFLEPANRIVRHFREDLAIRMDWLEIPKMQTEQKRLRKEADAIVIPPQTDFGDRLVADVKTIADMSAALAAFDTPERSAPIETFQRQDLRNQAASLGNDINRILRRSISPETYEALAALQKDINDANRAIERAQLAVDVSAKIETMRIKLDTLARGPQADGVARKMLELEQSIVVAERNHPAARRHQFA